MEAGRDDFGIPKPTFGRTVQVGHDLTLLPQPGHWPEIELVTSPEDNDGSILVLHPWSCVTFFTAVPSSWEPLDVKQRVEEEAAMLTGQSDQIVEQEYVRSAVVADERIDHLFVTCVSPSVTELTQRLSNRSVRLRTSLSAVSSLVMETQRAQGLKVTLGWYERFVEVTVVRDNEWLFGGFSPYRDPLDCLYYMASLLDRLHLDPLDLQAILLYGSFVDSAPEGPLSQLFATGPSVLRPAGAFPNATETFLSEPAFVPCAGAVLKQLFAEV